VKRFPEEHTDEAHPVTLAGLLAHLGAEGIATSRKTVSQDIGELIASGIDVVCNAGKLKECFIGDRYFELLIMPRPGRVEQAEQRLPGTAPEGSRAWSGAGGIQAETQEPDAHP